MDLVSGGYTNTSGELVESWDGTNWTEVTDLNTARDSQTGCGIQQQALCIWWDEPPRDTKITNEESWNGTSWTELNNLNTARRLVAGGNNQKLLNLVDKQRQQKLITECGMEQVHD